MRLGLAALLLLALTACGSSDDQDGASGPTSTSPSVAETSSVTPTPTASSDPQADLEKTYRTYVDAFLSGDGATAYGLLSKRCQAAEPLSEFADISESAADLYGSVKYTIKNVTVDGKRGTVDAEYAVAALNQGGGSTWVLEGGEWRTDKCD